MIDYVNTLDAEEGTDALQTPSGLTEWLSEHDLLDPTGDHASACEQRDAIALREALRRLMLENNGGAADADAWDVLERSARGGELAAHFDRSGSLSLLPQARGTSGALAQLLVPVASSIGDGSWQRVKACRDSDCRWAFYDRSRNRSAVWCEMAVCGNRTKVRAYRNRAPGG